MLAALVVALVAGATYSLVALYGTSTWLRHTTRVRLEVAELRSTLVDAETGVRGYLATSDPTLLAPFDRASVTWHGRMTRVRELTSDNALQQDRLRQLDTLVAREMETLSLARQGYERGQTAADLRPVMRVEDRAAREIRSLLGEMELEEERLDASRRLSATRRGAAAFALFASGALTFLGFMTLMARQRRQELASRARAEDQQRLLEAVFAGIQDGITLQDRTGKIVFANASAARMIGFDSPAALMAAAPGAIIEHFEVLDDAGHPFEPERLPAHAVLDGAPPGRPTVLRYRRHPAGQWRWSTLEAYPVRDANGAIVQAISVFRDVTAQRASDERDRFLLAAVDELTASLDYEATLAAVARLSVPTLADWCAVDIVDTGGQAKRVATAHVDPAKVAAVLEIARRYPPDPRSTVGTAEVLRTGRAQLIARIPRELITSRAVDDEHLRLIDQLDLRSYMAVPLAVGGKVLGAITFAMAESRRVYGETDLAFARALADRAALAIENARLFREIQAARAATTDRLVEEEERRAYAEERTRFAETFVGMLGHDLRNPLNAITITARLLLRTASEARERTAVERILSSAGRMSNMVTQLLDLTRSRLAGGIPIQKTLVDLGALVSEVVDEHRRGTPGREIVWSAPAGVDVSADRDRLAQVISNLLGNALEHGDAARPVVVTLAADADVALTVHNEGPPIAADVMPVLFQPFRQTRGERSRGLGLGLFITEQIVLAHGGRVEVRSMPEEGTTFAVHLPRFVSDDVEKAPPMVLP
jgi:signal transduction histidine kinase/CHASE3 domain sensor protein